MKRIRTEQWKQDPRLMPWQEELEAANKRIERLRNENSTLELQNNMNHFDLQNRDMELVHLRWKLAEAQAEIVRLNVLLDSQSRKRTPPASAKPGRSAPANTDELKPANNPDSQA